MRGETGARDLSANVGRHLSAGRSSGGDISADREDSPLQSKRSSMCKQKKIQITKYKYARLDENNCAQNVYQKINIVYVVDFVAF